MKLRNSTKSTFLFASTALVFYSAGTVFAGGPVPPSGCCATHYCYDEDGHLVSEATDCVPFYCKKGEKCHLSGGCDEDGNAWADAECLPVSNN